MRRRRAEPRVPLADPKYNSLELSRLINRLMMCGKKTIAQGIVYRAMDRVQERSSRNPLEIFQEAMRKVTPLVEVKPRRVGGATYQIPIEVAGHRGNALAMSWILRAARSRKGRPMHEKLAQELMDAARGEGAAAKRREDLHRMAEANRAFVHYRW